MAVLYIPIAAKLLSAILHCYRRFNNTRTSTPDPSNTCINCKRVLYYVLTSSHECRLSFPMVRLRYTQGWRGVYTLSLYFYNQGLGYRLMTRSYVNSSMRLLLSRVMAWLIFLRLRRKCSWALQRWMSSCLERSNYICPTDIGSSSGW